jgi:hypothetical protein
MQNYAEINFQKGYSLTKTHGRLSSQDIRLAVRNVWLAPESIEWFIEDQAFSLLYDLSLFTQKDWEREITHWQERGRGWGRSQFIHRRESIVLYKSFNTLWPALKL